MTRKQQADGCGIKVNAVTQKGGAVVVNADHGVWLSYAVATVGAEPPREVLYAGIKLKGKDRGLQIRIDREAGVVTVDLVTADGGSEIFRATV